MTRGHGSAWVAVACGLLAGGPLPGGARAEGPIVDVTKNPDARIAVGIGKYDSIPTDRVGSPPGDVLAFDLEISGWFEAKRPGVLPPATLNDWGKRGAEVLAEMEVVGNDLRGSIRDVGTGEVLFQRAYASGGMRERIHRFADDVVQALTGEKGVARTRLVCEWDSGKGKRIVAMDIDGFNMKSLTGDSELEVSPRWSPNGSAVVYTSYASGYPDVYVHDLRVGNRTKVAHYEGLNAQGDLSPDGSRLVASLSYSGNPEICSKELSSGRIRRLTNHAATDASPCWSPDGRRVAFVSDRTGSPQVWIVGADGGGLERITVRGSYNTAPEWSPDGKKIAYCALRPDGFQIQVIDLGTREVTTVTEGGGCEDPSWSPDGRSLLYSRRAGGRTDLYITNLDERKALRVTKGSGSFTTPDWSPYR
jgi:TolB protein